MLLEGLTGSSKKLFTQAIHQASGRRGKAFVAVNCSAFPKDLLESELFGYKKGAFTGALTDKKGLLEEANGSTPFSGRNRRARAQRAGQVPAGTRDAAVHQARRY